MTYLMNLSLSLLLVTVAIGIIHNNHQVLATTTENNDDAIEKEMDKRQDQTKEMAETALLNGTCLDSLDIMKILAHPDRDVAILETEIPSC
jgi:hypothetical protein